MIHTNFDKTYEQEYSKIYTVKIIVGNRGALLSNKDLLNLPDKETLHGIAKLMLTLWLNILLPHNDNI